jgi:glycosyltransferase involved in cell wall biosynthesis
MNVMAMLHAYPPMHNAGAEWMVHSMLRPLAAGGHQVDVVLSQDRGEPYELDGVHVHPHRDKNDPVPFLADADVIVTHLENTARATILGGLHDIPVVHVCHNTFLQTANWLRRGASLAVFNSEWMREYLSGPYQGWSVVVRPPVFGDDYATTPGDAVTLVNLYAEKGPATFYGLAERMPDVQFLGVRGGYGGQVIRTDLPNVEILDHVPGHEMAARVYSRTRVLLMPSSYESWGRAAVEAMHSGIPVIAHPTPGLRESLGDVGVFADRADVGAWETELRRLLDGRRWRAASRRAKARASELDPAVDLDRWTQAVQTLAERRTRVRVGNRH